MLGISEVVGLGLRLLSDYLGLSGGKFGLSGNNVARMTFKGFEA